MHPLAVTLLSTALAAALLLPRRQQKQPRHESQQGSAALQPLPPPPPPPSTQLASTTASPSSAKKGVSPKITLPIMFMVLFGLVSAAAIGFYQRDWETATKVALASIHLALAAVTGAWLADQLFSSKSIGKHPGQLGRQNVAHPPAQHPPNTLLSGKWIKAPESESMAEACDLMQLGGLVRLAINLIKGVEFHITAGRLDMAVFSIISWFKVKESYPLSGAAVLCNRRDLRRGKHTGRCRIIEGGSVELDMQWGEPYPGRGRDVLRLVSPNELHVTTTLFVGSRQHTYTTVYRRKD